MHEFALSLGAIIGVGMLAALVYDAVAVPAWVAFVRWVRS